MQTLFDLPYAGNPPHVAGSATSEAAAESIAPDAATLRAKVFEAIAAAGADGRTDEELQDALAMSGSTQRPRRRELELRGQVKDGGRRRRTKCNRWAVVWVVN